MDLGFLFSILVSHKLESYIHICICTGCDGVHVTFAQWVDDSRFAPVYQMSYQLKDLKQKTKINRSAGLTIKLIFVTQSAIITRLHKYKA